MAIGDRIKILREKAKMSQEELGSIIGASKQTVFKYENGIITNIPTDKVERLASFFGVSPAYIMGWEEALPSNVVPLKAMKKIPKVGNIACGTPILAEQNIEEYIDLPSHIHADYALTCKGNSMINAGIHDGDIVYIRQQPTVENGQIAAVMVGDDEATLKRVYVDDNMVTLMAENPSVRPFVYVGNEVSKLRIIGLAVAFTHCL